MILKFMKRLNIFRGFSPLFKIMVPKQPLAANNQI